MRLLAADWSMSAPSFAIYDSDDGDFNFCNSSHYYLTTVRKHVKTLPNLSVYGALVKDYETNEERWDNLSNTVIEAVSDMKIDFFAIEGYAFGSHAGSVHQIAENAAVLKHKIYNLGIPIEVINPSTVKKWYSGKGNAKKDELYKCFVEKTGIHLRDYFDLPETQWEPLAGVVDSWILLSILYEMKTMK